MIIRFSFLFFLILGYFFEINKLMDESIILRISSQRSVRQPRHKLTQVNRQNQERVREESNFLQSSLFCDLNITN